MQEIFNTYCWEKDRQVFTYNEHHIPGLKNFAHQNITTSIIADPFHYHSDIIEIHCMIKGERIVYLEGDEGLSRHVIYGNEVFVTFPYEIHQNGDSAQSPCEFYAFQINLRDHDNLLCLDREYSNHLCDQLLSLRNRHLSLSSTEISLLRRAFNLFSSKDKHDIKTAVVTLVNFLFNLQYMTPVNHGARNTQDENIKKVVMYINQNLQESVSLEKLAKISSYSISHFKTRFKEEIGIPPAEYITLQKIKYAKKMLETTDLSVTELSYELGFSSSNYFSTVFKKILNITPQQYKKNFTSTLPPRTLVLDSDIDN